MGRVRGSNTCAVRWRVHGQVQGVGFRWFVRCSASGLAVAGDVCNLPDGRVEIRARGADEQLRLLLERIRQGPPGSRVDGVETLEPEYDLPADDEFHIRFH